MVPFIFYFIFKGKGKMNKLKVVAHNGIFHTDEVLAIAALELFNDKDGGISITRTRDKDTIDSADVVFDVGGVYDPENCRFDHHQPSFNEGRYEGNLFSSAGLCWKHYGYEIGRNFGIRDPSDLKFFHKYVDDRIFLPVDRIDTGERRPRNGELHFSQLISMMNDGDDESFQSAVTFAKLTLITIIKEACKKIKERDKMEKMKKEQKGNKILVMDEFIQWTTFISARDGFERVVFPDVFSGTWRVQVRGKSSSLPSSWGGLNGEALSKETGVADCIFCHRALFIAGNKTREGAIEMAKLSIL